MASAKTKKEIDKELMYKKLMPSAPKIVKLEEVAPENAAPLTEILPGVSPAAVKEEPPRREFTPRKISTIPALDNRSTVVVNVMENAVLEKLESVLARFQCCRCDRCKKDIIAIALNKLPPKYRVMTELSPEPEINAQLNAQIVTAMIQAVIQVRAKPRH